MNKKVLTYVLVLGGAAAYYYWWKGMKNKQVIAPAAGTTVKSSNFTGSKGFY